MGVKLLIEPGNYYRQKEPMPCCLEIVAFGGGRRGISNLVKTMSELINVECTKRRIFEHKHLWLNFLVVWLY